MIQGERCCALEVWHALLHLVFKLVSFNCAILLMHSFNFCCFYQSLTVLKKFSIFSDFTMVKSKWQALSTLHPVDTCFLITWLHVCSETGNKSNCLKNNRWRYLVGIPPESLFNTWLMSGDTWIFLSIQSKEYFSHLPTYMYMYEKIS